MIFDPYLDWLGFKTFRPAVGVHITSTHVTIVALRRRPLRVVAIGRRDIPDNAVVDNEIRLVRPVAETLRLAAGNARISPGSPTVATIEPLADSLSVDVDGATTATADVADHAYERLAAVIAEAGLSLRLIDPLPVALARIGQRCGVPAVAVDSPTGWAVVHGGNRLEGQRLSGRPDPATLCLGNDLGSAAPVPVVPGIDVPSELRSLHDPGLDAVAIGAAMAALGRGQQGPHVVARPVAMAAGSGWTVQRIDQPTLNDRKEAS